MTCSNGLTADEGLRRVRRTLQTVRETANERMDAFSEILSGVKLSGALFFTAEFSAPWCFASPASNTLAPLLAPGTPHLVIYHFVINGTAFVTLPDGESIELGPGDIVVLPHGDP